MAEEQKKTRPTFIRLREWCQSYGRADGDDSRGTTDVMVCETREFTDSLRTELYQISQGNFEEKILEQILTLRRKAKYGSYQEWSKLMLKLMASFKG